MLKAAGKNFFASLLVGATLSAVAFSALADNHKSMGYAVDKSGMPVLAKGGCVVTPKHDKVKPFEQCGDMTDSDGDGVSDDKDQCKDTPKGVKVNEVGCPADSDNDTVADYLDKCPNNTPAEIAKGVDVNGCPIDSDGDKVPDYRDDCPQTPADLIHKVNERGCAPVDTIVRATIDGNQVNFAFDKAELNAAATTTLDALAKKVNNEKQYVQSISVTGHTDSIGSDAYNQGLSERRANAVAGHLKAQGVTSSIEAKGDGESKPAATNKTASGRATNRRVVIDVRMTK